MKALVRTFVPLLVCGALLAAGCATKGKTGAATGAAVGALAGQAIGGDTGATLLGAAIGAGAGYAVGNEMDKSDAAEREAQAKQERMRQEQAAGGAVGEASTSRSSPLAGSRWKVVSLVAAEPTEYASKLVNFTATTVTTTTTYKDGRVESIDDNYKLVGNGLIVTRPNEVINAQFDLDGNTLIVNCNEFRAVLERL